MKMIKSQEELTSIEKDLFNILINKLGISKKGIINYIIKIYENPHENRYCVNYKSFVYDRIVQSKDFDVNILKKELRKVKLLKMKNK